LIATGATLGIDRTSTNLANMISLAAALESPDAGLRMTR